jgi:hypothetical protein
MEDLVMGFEMGINDVNVCVPVLWEEHMKLFDN